MGASAHRSRIALLVLCSSSDEVSSQQVHMAERTTTRRQISGHIDRLECLRLRLRRLRNPSDLPAGRRTHWSQQPWHGERTGRERARRSRGRGPEQVWEEAERITQLAVLRINYVTILASRAGHPMRLVSQSRILTVFCDSSLLKTRVRNSPCKIPNRTGYLRIQ